ncbi:MAG: Drug resistance transporter EmrB/QacA subfamily [Caulobacteraceae bacterium]|nr:Drug resistance transporter EmrB/QacA subfamily [Caulobacteraceae bacterium]
MSVTADAGASPAAIHDPDAVSMKTWMAVVGSALGAFLAILNIQVVASSLADIQGAIGAGVDDGGWITTSYLVAEIIVIPLSAWLARAFSLRAYMLTNTFLFLALSVACAFATNLNQMIVVRFLQGCAGGVLIPLAFNIIMTRLPPSKHPTGLAIYSVSAIFAPSIGPVIGGYFNDTFGWQSIFLVNLLPGAVMMAMLWFSIEKAPPQLDALRKADWAGVVTMAVGLASLETVLEEGNKDDWLGSAFITRLAVTAVVALVAFIVIELVRKEPLLHLRLLKRRNFGLATVANFFFGVSMYGWVYLVPLYLARSQGYNAQQIGGVLIWIGLPQLAIIPFMPKLMKRMDPRLLVIVGYILFIVGSLLAMNLSGDFSGPQFIGSSLTRAVAQSMVMTPLSVLAVSGIEREYAGSASALFNMLRNLGGAVGIAVLQTFLTKREQFHSNVLTGQVSLLGQATRHRLDQLAAYFMGHGVSDGAYARHEAAVAVGRVIRRQASVMAYGDTIILQSALLGLALLAVLFLKKPAPGGSAGEAH